MKIFLLAIAFYYYLLYYIQRNHRERFRFLFSKNKNVFSSQVAHLHEYGKRNDMLPLDRTMKKSKSY